jgi:hypothetical protein
MRAFFEAGGTGVKADAIAARQLTALRAYQGRGTSRSSFIR